VRISMLEREELKRVRLSVSSWQTGIREQIVLYSNELHSCVACFVCQVPFLMGQVPYLIGHVPWYKAHFSCRKATMMCRVPSALIHDICAENTKLLC
jgi:hypothetical protein